MTSSKSIRRAGTLVGVAVLAVGGTALPANAADFIAPSCRGFDVGVTFLTSHGNPVHAGPRAVISAGSGTSRVDNETTGKAITILGAGSFKAEDQPDGSTLFMSNGRTVVLLFPTDQGGPASTLYVGGLVTRLDQDGNFAVVSHTGTTQDLCAALD